jgi:hypothetical protein
MNSLDTSIVTKQEYVVSPTLVKHGTYSIPVLGGYRLLSKLSGTRIEIFKNNSDLFSATGGVGHFRQKSYQHVICYGISTKTFIPARSWF